MTTFDQICCHYLNINEVIWESYPEAHKQQVKHDVRRLLKAILDVVFPPITMDNVSNDDIIRRSGLIAYIQKIIIDGL